MWLLLFLYGFWSSSFVHPSISMFWVSFNLFSSPRSHNHFNHLFKLFSYFSDCPSLSPSLTSMPPFPALISFIARSASFRHFLRGGRSALPWLLISLTGLACLPSRIVSRVALSLRLTPPLTARNKHFSLNSHSIIEVLELASAANAKDSVTSNVQTHPSPFIDISSFVIIRNSPPPLDTD